MTELDFNQDGDASGRHTESINSITLGHDIAGKLAGEVSKRNMEAPVPTLNVS